MFQQQQQKKQKKKEEQGQQQLQQQQQPVPLGYLGRHAWHCLLALLVLRVCHGQRSAWHVPAVQLVVTV